LETYSNGALVFWSNQASFQFISTAFRFKTKSQATYWATWLPWKIGMAIHPDSVFVPDGQR